MRFDIDYSTGNDCYSNDFFSMSYSFDMFQPQNPTYLERLKNRIDILYRTYSALHAFRQAKLEADPRLEETANLLGFGLLMRHALEAISIDLVWRAGLEAGKKTASERLKDLKGQSISGYAREQEQNLFIILERTNKIAHPHVIEDAPTYKSFVDLYNSTFRSLIDFHIGLTTRRNIRQYLKSMKKRMDNFSLKDSITRTLALGNLIRQLTECTANLWCYNNHIVPTDASTSEKQISLSEVLTVLGNIAKVNRDSGNNASSMSCEMITSLFKLKNTANALMHVAHDEIGLFQIWKNGLKIRTLHAAIVAECSPGALEVKIDPSARKKAEITLTILCGFFGWFGVHHFYAGNILKGIFFLLTFGGFLIGTPISLISICLGRFRTRKWGHLNKVSPAAIAIAIAFIVLYIALYYLFFLK